jgi:hypothetical protein
MQVKGQQGTALAAYNSLADNERADQVAQRQTDVASMKYMGRMGGMLNSIQNSKDPAGQYERMLPNLKSYAERYHLPLDGLPEKYDPEAVSTYVMGNVDVDDQMKIEDMAAYRQRRLGQMDETIEQRGEYQNARIAQGDRAEGGRNQRAAISEAGKTTRGNQTQQRFEQKNPPRRVIKTPKGDMILSTSGNRGMIGDQKWDKQPNGQWKRVG